MGLSWSTRVLIQHSLFRLGLDSDTCAEINPSRTPTNDISSQHVLDPSSSNCYQSCTIITCMYTCTPTAKLKTKDECFTVLCNKSLLFESSAISKFASIFYSHISLWEHHYVVLSAYGIKNSILAYFITPIVFLRQVDFVILKSS